MKLFLQRCELTNYKGLKIIITFALKLKVFYTQLLIMRKLLLSLCLIAIFGIVATIINLKMIESPKIESQNISEINNVKIPHSKKENISQETNLESSCCSKILKK